MRIERFGEGDPEVAVVGGIHGDEPCGVTAIEHLLADPPSFERPVALVLANERAIDRGVRYVDADLNRSFPGERDAAAHEERLAARLREAIGDSLTLSLHSTQSYGGPFGIVNGLDEFAREIAPQLPLDALVDTGEFVRGRIFEGIPRTIEVECGFQGSQAAAENGIAVTEAFLAAVGAVAPDAVDADQDPDSLSVFRLDRRVPKREADSYAVHVPNFEAVEAGEAFASSDGDPLRAEETFYPVLLSAEGYDEQFGYAARYVETFG